MACQLPKQWHLAHRGGDEKGVRVLDGESEVLELCDKVLYGLTEEEIKVVAYVNLE